MLLIFCQFGFWLSSIPVQPGFCGLEIVTQLGFWLSSIRFHRYAPMTESSAMADSTNCTLKVPMVEIESSAVTAS